MSLLIVKRLALVVVAEATSHELRAVSRFHFRGITILVLHVLEAYVVEAECLVETGGESRAGLAHFTRG